MDSTGTTDVVGRGVAGTVSDTVVAGVALVVGGVDEAGGAGVTTGSVSSAPVVTAAGLDAGGAASSSLERVRAKMPPPTARARTMAPPTTSGVRR